MATKPLALPPANDSWLFTPGPLTTSATVKQAMLRDLGSRDPAFIEIVRDIRRRLLSIAGVDDHKHTCVLMQGSGTFGLESVIASTMPNNGRLLVPINGAYGRRLANIAHANGFNVVEVDFPEHESIDPDKIEAVIRANPDIGMVSIVHCETTTGCLNPIEPVVRIAKKYKCLTLVDAMSSFGALPINVSELEIDYLVSSANKCIEGIPGFSLIIARLDSLHKTEDQCLSLSLDLHAQWKGLESNGQFRFTPPTHAILAFQQALNELDLEGGVEGRHARYRANHQTLVSGMRSLGYEPYLKPEIQAPIITAYRYPQSDLFDFNSFYERLSEQGYVIYPGKLSQTPCYRIGCIGRLFPHHFQSLTTAIGSILVDMGVLV